MKTIPWWIWTLVILGWLGAGAADKGSSGAVAWMLGVLVLVYAYYAGKNKDS